MKHTLQIMAGVICAGLGWTILLPAAETNSPTTAKERIGIYDSRVVAYAYFWSEAQQRRRNEHMAATKAAKAAGDQARLAELDAARRQGQDTIHRQIFSTAPVDAILDTLKPRVAEVGKQAGVTRLVSKWDKKALKQFKRAEQVDVTELLLAEFKLSDKQKKVVVEFRRQKPLSPEKCEELLRKGQL